MRDTSLYLPTGSRLHRLHPFTKLSWLLLTAVAAWVWGAPLTLLALLTLLHLGIAARSGIFAPCWKLFSRTLLPLMLFMLPIHGLLFPDNRSVLVTWQGIPLYREGLLFATRTLLQLAAVFTASLLVVFSVHPADLVAALQKAGCSPRLAWLLGSPLLLLPAMRGRIHAIREAQAARGLETTGSLLQRARSLFPLLYPLVIGAFSEVEERAIALDVRGFSNPGSRTLWRQVEDSAAQRLCRLAMLLAALCLIVLRVLP